MNSMAAVALHLLGEEAMADRWARTVCYMWMGRERGHAEGIFSAARRAVGAALAPKEEFHALMNQMRWAYEMGRTRDGGITFMRGSRWTYPNMTAAAGLFLCLPERRLQILGGDSVFTGRPPRGLEKAAQLHKDKRWAQLRTMLADTIKAGEKGNVAADGLAYAKKLLAAHDRLEKHAAATLIIIEQSIQDGMLATAQTQLDLCEPYLQTAIDTLNNPEVLNMYGFFSNHPPHGALELFSHYSDNPLVRAHLSGMLRFAVRKRGSLDSYWYAIVEFPHRILIKIGPEALPELDAFCKSEEALYKQIQAGQVEQPGWWKEDSIKYLTEWRRQMEVTAELVRCLYGKRATGEAIVSMCEIYLSSRPWGAWERQQIRDHLMELGPKSLPMLRRSVADRLPALTARFDRQIAAKQAEAEAEIDKRARGAIQKELEAIEGHKGDLAHRVEELRGLTSLVDADERTLAKALAALDAEEEFWKPQWARKSMLPLARIAQEREDIRWPNGPSIGRCAMSTGRFPTNPTPSIESSSRLAERSCTSSNGANAERGSRAIGRSKWSATQ